MIIAIDVETLGLDCTKYLTGCLIKETTPDKPEIYDKRENLWNRILELAEKENKRGKTLNVYSHNASYDFYSYAPLKDKRINYFCHNPFIVSYTTKDKREGIKFLDTYAIMRMSLQKVGKLIGHEKLEIPEELKYEEEQIEQMTEEQINELREKSKPYMIRDTEIVLKTIERIKKELKEQGITCRRIMTINQIAINALINNLRNNHLAEEIFWDIPKGETRRTLRAEEIHSAYRGGKVEAYKTGKIENVTIIDCNSLYPHIASTCELPNLKTERKNWKPEGINEKKIGIARVLMKNENNKIGLLPVRTTFGNYYPRPNKYIIGTYTFKEIGTAVQEGYDLLAIEWTVEWEKSTDNYLRNYMKTRYMRRTLGKFENHFNKMIMNGCIGKLAQTRNSQEIKIASIEEAEKYIDKNYKIVKGIGYDMVYKKNTNEYTKKYYTPIIPTIINANARIYMYHQYKKIGYENLVYTDTDSIAFTHNIPSVFMNAIGMRIGEKLGEFKIEHLNKDMLIYGRKTYKIGDKMKASGIHPAGLNEHDFEQGYAQQRKMVTIKTEKEGQTAGKFTTELRDLKEQHENHIATMQKMEEQDIYIDNDINNINYFIPYLQ